MRNYILKALLAILLPGAIHSQINNAGFENWSGNNPENWTTNNIAPLELFPIFSSSDAHSGALAVKGEVLDNPLGTSDVYPPLIQTNVSPLTEAPNTLTGWYKFSPLFSSSSLVVSATAVDANGVMTGFTVGQFYETSNSYASFSLELDYSFGSGNATVAMSISATIADDGGEPAIGTYFLLDDFSLNGISVGLLEDAATLKFLKLSEPYPQPFDVATRMTLSTHEQMNICAEVLDINGRRCDVLLEQVLPKGEFKLYWQPSTETPNGLYFMKLSTDYGIDIKRMVLYR
jgi:hypothetical protein